MHLSGGGDCRIGADKVGNYCGFNAGVLIGTKDSLENRPVLGDHVAFGPGAKAFGKLTIGNNVFVASNAVVTKDVPDNCIVGGIPAKVLKYKEQKEQ
jgi:serine O-acetyltransferase